MPRAPSPSDPNWTRKGGRRPPFLLLLPLPFPLLVGVGKRGVLLLLGGGLLLLARPTGPAGLPPCSFIYGGRGHPRTHKLIIDLSQPCAVPPSTIIHLGHIVAVLRRSPATVASSTLSPRHHADETLPRALLDCEFAGRHRAERVLNAEVPYVRY